MKRGSREDAEITARMIASLASMSEARVVSRNGVVHIGEALDDKVLVSDLIRFGLKMLSGSGTWAPENDAAGRRGLSISVIGFAFDYALEIAPLDGAAISPRALAGLIRYIEAGGETLPGYPEVAEICAEYVMSASLSPERNGV